MPPIVAMTGGGIKGAVAAARYAQDHELIFVHLDYGQPSASAEAKAVEGLAASLPVGRVARLDLPHVLQLQRGPHGPRETSPESAQTDLDRSRAFSRNVLSGLVPVLMSVAVQCAMRVGASKVVTGLSRWCEAMQLGLPPIDAHGDSRREFLHAFNIMLEDLGVEHSSIRVEAPLMDMTYAEVVKLAIHFRVPLDQTWTCERAGPQPCERCQPCKARAEACIRSGVVDPLTNMVRA